MGRDKALIEIDGVALVERISAILLEAGCCRVVAVGPRRLAAAVPHVDDRHPGEGPLGGILTAIAAASSSAADAVLVVACDLVDLDPATVSTLLEAADPLIVSSRSAADAVVARSTRLEPLCAVWSLGCAVVLQRHFDSGERAVHRALDGVSVIEVAVTADVVRNVNTLDDLRSE